ncbi:hypothetical protein [Moorena producens]|uniref:hypothetical protein n=1 Tax=Moorena producens TaxID=1155739 RepID=UPI003C7541B3
MSNVGRNPILLLRIGIGFNIALRAMALATGNRQKLTAIAFAAYKIPPSRKPRVFKPGMKARSGFSRREKNILGISGVLVWML